MAGRPRKATKVLELSGAHKKNPNRSRPNEPDGNGIFPSVPPSHLNEDQHRHWLEIVAMVPAGVLTGSDIMAVELLAVLVTEWRNNYYEFPASKLARLSIEMGRLGLSPTDRAKLSIEKPSANKFAS